ncbi:MAG: YdcF family protein [Alphaproteobacteria bacterium]|nr:YdcF family protein [Alphaproteobacteria bacterium]
MSILFFIASKLIWVLIRPETWLVIGLAWGCLLLKLHKISRARRVLSATLIAALAITILPLGELLIRPLETSYPANPTITAPNGIIVLGGAEDARRTAYWRQVQLNDAAERFTAALALARRFPNAKIVFTGGSGSLRDALGKGISGATVAKLFFSEQGIPANRLILESKSRNTAANARLTYALLRPKPGQTWVLVTSAFHMPRAMRSFRRAGWTGVIPYPVDYRSGRFADDIGWNLAKNLKTLNIAVKEYVGLLAYSLTGR